MKFHGNKGRKRPDLAARNRARATHGHTRNGHASRTYSSWQAMMERSHHGRGKDAARYYRRGIRVCRRWLHFENFIADMGERPPGKTIDRINNRKGYSPSNCRWATQIQQALNSSGRVLFISAFGRKQHLKAWERETGLSRQAIRYRLMAGWPPELALSLEPDHGRSPVHKMGRRRATEPTRPGAIVPRNTSDGA